jgi:hypothetical protein
LSAEPVKKPKPPGPWRGHSCRAHKVGRARTTFSSLTRFQAPVMKAIPVRLTRWKVLKDAWQLDEIEFVVSKLLGPDGRPLWQVTHCGDVADLLADTELMLDAEKGTLPSEPERRKARKRWLMEGYLYVHPGERRLNLMGVIIDVAALQYLAAKARFGAPKLDLKRQRRVREAAAALKRELAVESQANARHPARAEFCAEQNEMLKNLDRLRVAPSRFAPPWHRFARDIFVSFVAMTRDPDVRTRSRDARAVRFVQRTLAYIGVHVGRPAIFKVLSDLIASTDDLFEVAAPPRKKPFGSKRRA